MEVEPQKGLRHALGDRPPWRGVNLGGWLLLEPGTAKALFSRHPTESGKEATSEWELMQILRKKGALHELEQHRRTCITKADFLQIRACGLNAVRLPVGYWTVIGPSQGDPFVGPALHLVDRAVRWAEECGLQILLDLHGAPGGESGDAPCGREQPPGQWQWPQWRMEESLRALETLAERYCTSDAVTGIEVCNEPSSTIPASMLCQYYSSAVEIVRGAGMHADQVTVVLPLFQRSSEEFLRVWDKVSDGLHQNVCFDFHYYHCFGHGWNGKTFAQQLRAVQQNARELRKIPAVVGEWSLALGLLAEKCCKLPTEQMRRRFAQAQLAAYKEASHGWFFWNWCDAHGTEWNWQQSFKEGFVHAPKRCRLPSWDGVGEDPLEEDTDPSPPDPTVRFGDAVFLRTFHGRYIDLGGPKECASARWADRGAWQRFTIWPPVDRDVSELLRCRTIVQHGDVVRLLAHTGHFLGIDGGKVTECPDIFSDTSAEFVVHVEGAGKLKHKCAVFLENRANACVVDIDGNGSGKDVSARWKDFGEWQRLAVEKVPEDEGPAAPPKVAPRAAARSAQSPQGAAAERASSSAAASSTAATRTPSQSRKRSPPSPWSTPPSKAHRSTFWSPTAGRAGFDMPQQAVGCRTPEKVKLRRQSCAAAGVGRSPEAPKKRRSLSSTAQVRGASGAMTGQRWPWCRRVSMDSVDASIPTWLLAGA